MTEKQTQAISDVERIGRTRKARALVKMRHLTDAGSVRVREAIIDDIDDDVRAITWAICKGFIAV